MTESRKIQLEAEMSTAGVKQGAQDIKATVSDMANAVSQEAGRAGQAVGKIGDGGEQTSQKVDRTTKSMIQSIQRVTAQMEAGSRTSAKYYETLAQQRGVDVNALRPYLDQLDDVSKKQSMASGALAAGAVQFDKYGMSAKQTAAAMRGVPAQLTDIVVSLQSGQQPMTVLLQQGGQLKDMFGGIAPAARALGGAVLGMVNPLTLAAAAVGGLYLAYRAGASEAEAFNKTIIMTGNVAGTSADQLMGMAQRIDGVVGTQRQAAQALNLMAGSTKIAAQQFEQLTATAIAWERATGTAVADTVKQFEELGKAPVEASLKLNESMNYLTASTYRQIKALQDVGRENEAAALAQREYDQALRERTPLIVENLGYVEKAWRAIKDIGAEAIDDILKVGRIMTTAQQLAAAQRAYAKHYGDDDDPTAYRGSFNSTSRAAARQRIEQLQEQMRWEAAAARQRHDIARQEREELERVRFRDDYLGDRQSKDQQRIKAIEDEQQAFTRAVRGLQKDSAEYERIYAAHKIALANIDKQFEDKKQSGGIGATQTELARLNAMLVLERQRAEQLAVVGGEVEKLNEAEKLALQYAERAKLATDAKTKARLEHNKSLAEEVGAMRRANDLTEKDLRAADQTINKLRQQTQSIEDQVATYGLGKVAIEDLAIARLEEKLAIDEALDGHDAVIAKTREEIEARKQLREAMVSLETKEAEKRAWESWSRDVEQIFQQVGQSLTDAIFEGGKSGRDLVKDLFKTLTLRVLINPVMNSIQGAVTNSLGGMFGMQNPQAGNGLMGTVNNLSSLNTAYGAISQALTGASAGASTASLGYANLVGAFGGDSIGALISANGGWQGAMAGFGAAGAGAAGLAGVAAAPGFALGGTLGGTMATTSLSASLAGGTAAAGAGGAAAGGLAGIGSAIGAAAPWLLGGLAIGSAFGLFDDGPPKTRHGQRTTAELSGGRFGITSIDDRQAAGSEQAALAAAQSAVTAANEMFSRIGVNAGIESFYAIMESSVLGDRQGVASGGALRVGDELINFGIPQKSDMTVAGVGSWSEAEMFPRLQTDIQLSIIEAFKTQIDSLPDVLANMIRDVDVRSMDVADAQQLAARFGAILEGASSFLKMVEAMPFDQLRDMSFDAAAGLIQVAGGLENLTGNLNTYYENFYTETERNANTLRNVAKALEEVGVALPDTRAQFRALVEAQDLTTDAGRRVYAALLNVSGAFASVTQSAEQTAQEQQRIAAQNKQTVIDDLQTAYNDLVNAGQAEIAKLQQTFGETDSAMNSYRSAVQALESEFGSLFTSIDRYISDLRGNVEASAQAQYRQARAVISTALATGQLPQTADLTEALQVAQRGVTSQVYGSLFEQNRAYAILANEMEALKAIAEPELDAAKATLAQLEEQYALLRGTKRIEGDSLSALEQQVRLAFATEEAARHEISLVEQQLEQARQQHEKLMEALTGIDGGIKSLAEAMAAFAAAAAAAETVVSGGGGGGGGGSTGGWTPDNLPSGAENLSAAERYVLYNEDLLKAQPGSGMSVEQFANFHWNTYGQYEDRDIRYRAMGGYTPPGLTWVGEEGPELVNFKQPGMVYTAAQSANLMGGGGGRDVVMALERIEQRIERLEQPISQTAQATGQLADQFDNVTAGGNAMATEEMA